MNREDCEKLLDAFENAVVGTRFGTSESIPLAKAARDSLRDIIVGIMAGSAYSPSMRFPYTTVTVPCKETGKPVVTCEQ